ncbi:MarP family serine protease [Glaciihabitans sp. UYNi722]|uniref:MarP family serine protease n=1 Tax=Glaciihabitans sp. UYNi722 TaxID=3156344 RepID=UPI003398B1C9
MPGPIILDIALCLVLIAYTIYGFRAGFALSLASLLGLIVGAVAAFFAIPLVTGWVSASEWRLPAIIGAVILLLGLGQALGVGIGRAIKRGVNKSPLRLLDRLLGAVITLVVTAIVMSMIAFGLGSLGVPFVSQAIGSSAVVNTINRITPDPVKSLEATVRSLVAQDGLPRLLGAIGNGTPVAAPADGAATAAQQTAAQSVVKIVGNAFQCGQNQSGSGFVVSSGRVVTNAHVVAGVTEPVVQTQDGGAWSGRVVYFDTVNDLAVLAVSGLPTTPLNLGTDLAPGTKAVFDGFPLGGPFRSGPAAVQSTSTVDVADIYGANPSPRNVYYLAADVQEGNSGGPLLDSGGKVAGLVFAKSATSQHLGFAMTTGVLRPIVSQAASLSAAVSSGHCTRG